MNTISQFTKCCGCGACSQICPAEAITMTDAGAFYRPQVDLQRCVDCGRCTAVCPVNTPLKEMDPICSAWAGTHADPEVIRASSSGGAFTALARQILEEGGIVFGAAFSEDFRDVVIADTDRVPLEALRKSKYTESNTGDTFRRAKALLQQGRKVLYCGAPCQIAGLKKYLGKDFENLITCGFTCGGMPSHRLYRQYLEGLERKYGAKVTSVDFRPKTLGWENYAMLLEFENGKRHHCPARLDPYLNAFVYSHYSVADLCMECPFSDHHVSDLILADFWKHREFHGWEQPGDGLSLILAATSKGEELLKRAENRLRIRQLELTGAVYNIRKTQSTPEHLAKREAFWKDCMEQDLWAAARRHCLPGGWKRLKVLLKSLARQILRSVP